MTFKSLSASNSATNCFRLACKMNIINLTNCLNISLMLISLRLIVQECKLVMGVTMAGRSKAHRNWKAIDTRVTDAANEAKDNVKYLTTLEKSLEPMYTGK